MKAQGGPFLGFRRLVVALRPRWALPSGIDHEVAVTPRSLQAVLRSLADSGSPASDAELLKRFLAHDEAAFAELVRRYGRLVWTACRHQTRSEAEADDAFQATFLLLLRNASKIREGGKLSAWLHGVAYKVCAKSRLAASRRTARESTSARSEGTASAVPDSAWDRALEAVHEEAAKLPETLRVPFVLCCLEGKGASEAAEQLGWKLGTFSGRLTRAKDAVLAKLDARGLTLGAVAAIGLAAPPAATAAKASALARIDEAIPGSILQLSQGVIGMSVSTLKVLAATVLLTCGLGLTVGSGWLATAEAQAPVKPPPAKADAEVELKRATAMMAKARAEAEALKAKAEKEKRFVEMLVQADANARDEATFKTTKNEYDLVVVSEMDQTRFRKFLQDREDRGWEYCGTTPMADPKQLVWVFRRPLKTGTGSTKLFELLQKPNPLAAVPSKPAVYEKVEDARLIEAEIARLTAKLDAIKKAPKVVGLQVSFDKASSSLEPATLATVLADLGQKKFGKDGKYNVSFVNGVVTVFGDQEVIAWASAIVNSLSGK